MTEYSIKQIKAAFKAVAPNIDDVPECSAVIAELTKPGEVFAEGQIIAIKVNSRLQRARDVQTVDYSDCRALTQPEVGDSWKPADDYKMLRDFANLIYDGKFNDSDQVWLAAKSLLNKTGE